MQLPGIILVSSAFLTHVVPNMVHEITFHFVAYHFRHFAWLCRCIRHHFTFVASGVFPTFRGSLSMCPLTLPNWWLIPIPFSILLKLHPVFKLWLQKGGSITITEIQKLLFQLGCILHQRASRTNKQIPASEKGLNQIKNE